MDDRLIGTFTELPFQATRILVSDTVRIGMTRRRIPVLLEMDVTDARLVIEKRKTATGEGLSFTGWIIKCLAQAVSEHPRVHALRRGRRKLVLFNDVDVGFMVSRRSEGTDSSPDVPMPCLIRKEREERGVHPCGNPRRSGEGLGAGGTYNRPAGVGAVATDDAALRIAALLRPEDPGLEPPAPGPVPHEADDGDRGRHSRRDVRESRRREQLGNPNRVSSADGRPRGDRTEACNRRRARGTAGVPGHDPDVRPRRDRRRAHGDVPAAVAGTNRERIRTLDIRGIPVSAAVLPSNGPRSQKSNLNQFTVFLCDHLLLTALFSLIGIAPLHLGTRKLSRIE